jgi:hypothetical protein
MNLLYDGKRKKPMYSNLFSHGFSLGGFEKSNSPFLVAA